MDEAPLDHIEEDLILAVFDSLRTPGHSVGHRHWRLHLKLIPFLEDILAKDLWFCGLHVEEHSDD